MARSSTSDIGAAMHRKPFSTGSDDPEENPVIYGKKPEPYKIRVEPPTEPIPTQQKKETSEEDEAEADNTNRSFLIGAKPLYEKTFRRHPKELFLRLILWRNKNESVGWYRVGYSLALISLCAALGFLFASDEIVIVTCLLLFSIILMGYFISREIYRWEKRKITVQQFYDYKRIILGAPKSLFFFFNGNGSRNEKLEGSVGVSDITPWYYTYVFFGCGKLNLNAKTEGATPIDLDDITQKGKLTQILTADDPTPREP